MKTGRGQKKDGRAFGLAHQLMQLKCLPGWTSRDVWLRVSSLITALSESEDNYGP